MEKEYTDSDVVRSFVGLFLRAFFLAFMIDSFKLEDEDGLETRVIFDQHLDGWRKMIHGFASDEGAKREEAIRTVAKASPSLAQLCAKTVPDGEDLRQVINEALPKAEAKLEEMFEAARKGAMSETS